jgi:hypothetical protein
MIDTTAIVRMNASLAREDLPDYSSSAFDAKVTPLVAAVA